VATKREWVLDSLFQDRSVGRNRGLFKLIFLVPLLLLGVSSWFGILLIIEIVALVVLYVWGKRTHRI
jgi:hypothetical protein